MERMHGYSSASVALEKLSGLGYTIDYNIEFEDLLAHADEFKIDYLFRYEGASDPDDESTVYGISRNSGEKGVFVAGNLSLIEGKKRDILLQLELKEREH
ncbi:MAG: hypothetical protein K0R59_2736 [Sphingobacterium sp.]|jgi:hypothetical protein|uniref:hypothetical protein n=1 Tax=unclassified Sphingobacterium TaxID=2609468 RepID=UPI000986FA92|nr:hypothetical protein [Sphingobacterium sp. CZ-UAM]MDF2517440.1 hypothetical protein [Sphingobacterium sp.]OOG18922.1 hypothetical protein BWD42_02880 [Sphingobacterium sp. CZ-UAM]